MEGSRENGVKYRREQGAQTPPNRASESVTPGITLWGHLNGGFDKNNDEEKHLF